MSDNTVLIVDDEEYGRETVGDLLIPQGFYLIFAANGPEALEKAATFTPDVILLDVMMPGMDGFEVCRRLRADPRLAEVPVIMVTALDDRTSRLQGLEAGADDFISKPFDRLELRARVKTIIRLNRYRRLLTERSKFGWVVDKAHEGYLILNDNDEILYTNSQARLWLGLPADADAPYPETFLTLAKAHYHCEPQELWLAWPELPPMVSPNTARYLVRPETPTATTLWLQVEQMLMESGSAETYLLCLYDVTASKLNQTIMWGFHAQVSHKLRTSSTLLSGFLEIAMDDVSTLPESQLSSYLATAHKNALQLQDQIQHIFRYLEIPRLGHPERVYCRLSQISAIVAEIKTGLGLDSVSISHEDTVQPEQTCLVLSPQEVELILWELLENARKFHPTQAPAAEISLKPHPAGILLEVADNGVTLSPEQLAKVWQPYYQGEKYFTGQIPGMGLGLSMVATLVWRAGGVCRMRNRPDGPGVVVELMLPVKG